MPPHDRFHCRIHLHLNGHSSNRSEHPRTGTIHSIYHLCRKRIAPHRLRLANLGLTPRHTYVWGTGHTHDLWSDKIDSFERPTARMPRPRSYRQRPSTAPRDPAGTVDKQTDTSKVSVGEAFDREPIKKCRQRNPPYRHEEDLLSFEIASESIIGLILSLTGDA